MRLTPADELILTNYFNKLESPKIERFALWKLEPNGDFVFINDGPSTGDFSREKTEAEIQIGRSGLSHDLKTRAINALIGFSGATRVVGVAIRDPDLIQELVEAVKSLTHAKDSASKKMTH
jgi:hypothetical protein